MLRMAHPSSGRAGFGVALTPKAQTSTTTDNAVPKDKAVPRELQEKDIAKADKRPMLRMAHPSSGRSGFKPAAAPAAAAEKDDKSEPK